MNKSIVTFTRGTLAQATPLWQYDYGQVLEINGLELPTTYQVHFCNCSDTQTITVLGNADGVLIPDNLLQTGKTVIAYIYLHTGADDGETEYKITIPIRTRPAPSDIPPTPEQQSALDEAIAALNSAVDTVEDIADGIPDQINAALEEAKESGEFDGPPGPSGEGGNGIWWTTDAIAIRGAVYYTQERNVQGRAGATPQAEDLLVGPDPGTAGPVSYLYSVRGVENSLVYLDGIGSIKGETGPQGPSGEDGYSPTVTVTEIEGGHRVTITDEVGDHTFDVLDGEAVISKTVAGEILAIEDGTADKPTALSVEIPYQAGGISGFTMRFHRRNMLCLIGPSSSAGVAYTPQEDGTLLLNGTATGNSRYGIFGHKTYDNVSNIYNLPAGRYTVFLYYPEAGRYSNALTIYKGSSTTQIKSLDGLTRFTTAESQAGRLILKYTEGTQLAGTKAMAFLGVGDLTEEDFDAPATAHHELAVDFGQTVYGGTADLSGGVFLSKYASDGTELAEPVEIPITAEIPTLYEGANTIWASVVGSTVTMTYGKTAKDYIDEKTDALQEQIDTLDATTQGQLTGEYSSLGMFAKIGIIGDSYAQGSIHYPGGSGVYKPLSWGKHLERDLSIGVTLYTHGGYATRDWITDTTYGLPKLEADAATDPCDLYWFGLGINDSAYYDDHSGYLGALTDISSHVSGDPWAATFYGNMGQIVERIQTAAPSSKIVIASFVADRPKAPRTWDTALNNALADVAEYFGLPFIDLRDDPFYMSDFYTAQIYGDHPTAIGYAGMAQANERLFARAAVEYRAYFMDYHNATSFPSGGGGGTSDYDDLTNKPQINSVTLSGNKSAADLGLAPAGAYVKPSGGIPKSDLASAVQTSLGKADTALQSVPSTYRTAAAQDTIDAAQDTAIAGKLSTTGNAYRTASIPMGELDSTSTATVMTATVPGITELRDGVCVWLQNGVIASASGVTLNINALGAKPIYSSLAGTVVTTTFAKAATYLFIYNSTRVSGGCWDMVYGYDTNTTYTPAKLGQGYAVCSTAAATAAKTASISSYALTAGGIVAIKFDNDVPANATLNISSKGAKAIYYHGAAITAGVIKAGDTVTMIYSTYYHVLAIDRDEAPVTSVNGQTGAVSLSIPSTAAEIGAIAAPASPATGAFLVWNGSAWTAQTLATWSAGSY